jgi:competence protein ComEC
MYDTGIRFLHSNDMATLVIIPYLKRLGITHIDTVVISHPDLDHQGGLASLQHAFPIQTLLMNEASITHHSQSCHETHDWEWDGIRFHFFPIRAPLRGKNNHSCILQIINRTSKMLLTGDIELAAETYLLKTYGKQLQSTMMLIPHHLSKTSSSPNFVHQVNPQYAIASYGFDNRYHFPHPQAIKTYKKEHISLFNTMDCGMVTLNLRSKITKPNCYKKNNLS